MKPTPGSRSLASLLVLGLARTIGGIALQTAREPAIEEVWCGWEKFLFILHKPRSCPPNHCCSGNGTCGTTGQHCGGGGCQVGLSDSCDAFYGPAGENTTDIPRPRIKGPVPYGNMIDKCSKPGLMALTFDDAPSKYTEELLNLLDELKANVTFFVSGNSRSQGHVDDELKAWPGLLRRMHAAGHQIASSTWTHRDLDGTFGRWFLTYEPDRGLRARIRNSEVTFNEMVMRNVFGWFPAYIRPPGLGCGGRCQGFLRQRGYHVISTNFDMHDDKYDSAARIGEAKKKFSSDISKAADKNSYIVRLRDGYRQTVVNLTAHVVHEARARGYRLVTVGECVGDPKRYWYRPTKEPDMNRSAPAPLLAARAPVVEEELPPWPPFSIWDIVNKTRPKSPGGGPWLDPAQRPRCGPKYGLRCMGSKEAPCCSYWGICGSEPEYCGTGCRESYGTCDVTSGMSLENSTNGLCGVEFNAGCSADAKRPCCSEAGMCGSGPTSCGRGCQADYGDCM
ncbi:hypothetical protein CDD83_5423 [Cordyceps sp. RAO-2017]|nr:hypothetical protein CDD83_5423 [Cordyceps sp. RAO-2017]